GVGLRRDGHRQNRQPIAVLVAELLGVLQDVDADRRRRVVVEDQNRSAERARQAAGRAGAELFEDEVGNALADLKRAQARGRRLKVPGRYHVAAADMVDALDDVLERLAIRRRGPMLEMMRHLSQDPVEPTRVAARLPEETGGIVRDLVS